MRVFEFHLTAHEEKRRSRSTGQIDAKIRLGILAGYKLVAIVSEFASWINFKWVVKEVFGW